MSHPEYLFSGFDLCVDGNGNLSHLTLELDSRADFLEQKQIGRMFLTFKPSVSLPEAEELAADMNRCLRDFCIAHLADGEIS